MSKYFNVSLDYLLCQTEDERTLSNFKREDSKDLKDFLRDQSVMFTGLELSDQDKDKILHILTGLFWDDIINKK